MTTMLDKIGVRRDTAQTLAKAHEKELEAAKAEHNRLDGAKGVLRTNAQECIGAVRSYWKKDFDDGKVTQEQADVAFKVIEQIAGSMRALAQKCEVDQLIKQGLIDGMERAMRSCERLFEDEGRKAENFVKAVESGDLTIDKETGEPVHVTSERGEDGRPPLHVVGVRPAPGIAQMRKAEAAASKEAPAPVVVQNNEQDDGKKPKSKKRLTEAEAKGT